MMDALSFVRFGKLYEWDIKRTTGITSKFRYSECCFGKVLSKANVEWVDIEDNKDYPILGVHAQGGGVYINHVAKGKELTMKSYQKSQPYLLFYCKVRTVNGQWGVVYPQFADSYGSSNMQYLMINQELLSPYYLENLLKLKRLTKEWDKKAIGANGRHFPLKTLLQLEFPLPTKTQQDEIVARYNQTIAEAEAKETEAEQLESEIEQYLMGELGTSVLKSAFKNRINFVRFADTERWDVPYFISSTKAKSKYETVSITNCLDHFMEDMNGKAIRIETAKFPDSNFHYLGMENVEKNTGELIDLPVVKGSEIKSQTILIPQDFLIYGKLRPYLNKYWLNETQLTDIVCSSEFFVFHVKPSINTLYFKYVLASSFVQQQLSDQSSGARMPRINEKIFNNIQIPIPPIDVQKEIVDHISEMKAGIKLLKQEAVTLRDKALKDFENEIFE